MEEWQIMYFGVGGEAVWGLWESTGWRTCRPRLRALTLLTNHVTLGSLFLISKPPLPLR